MFGEAVSIIYDCFGLCNVLTALDPPFERLFCEYYNGGFCFKGGQILAEIFILEKLYRNVMRNHLSRLKFIYYVKMYLDSHSIHV